MKEIKYKNFISSSRSGPVNNYYGSGSASQKVTVPSLQFRFRFHNTAGEWAPPDVGFARLDGLLEERLAQAEGNHPVVLSMQDEHGTFDRWQPS